MRKIQGWKRVRERVREVKVSADAMAREGFTAGDNCFIQKVEVVSCMYALQTCLSFSHMKSLVYSTLFMMVGKMDFLLRHM